MKTVTTFISGEKFRVKNAIGQIINKDLNLNPDISPLVTRVEGMDYIPCCTSLEIYPSYYIPCSTSLVVHPL